MKYEQLKEISAERLVKDKPCADEFSRYLKYVGYCKINYIDNQAGFFNNFIQNAKHFGWINWLKENKYIREVEEEIKPLEEKVFYHVGQEFVSGSQRWLLSQVEGNQVVLMGLTGVYKGNRWRDPIAVQLSSHITQKEFDKISNNKPFTLITETSTCL